MMSIRACGLEKDQETDHNNKVLKVEKDKSVREQQHVFGSTTNLRRVYSRVVVKGNF